jgi:hypothetical protein
MEAIKAVYDGKAFIPATRVSLPKNKTVYLRIINESADGDSQEDISKALFETPLTDSIVGILEGIEIKTTDDIKSIKLAKYLK